MLPKGAFDLVDIGGERVEQVISPEQFRQWPQDIRAVAFVASAPAKTSIFRSGAPGLHCKRKWRIRTSVVVSCHGIA